MASLLDLRREYTLNGLRKKDLKADPIDQFRVWMGQALEAGLMDANAMTLSTAGSDLAPASRVVLLKGFDERGFLFFTNYDSPKGRQIAQNPRVALLFFWAQLERQIRIDGRAEKTSREDSETYFHSRPRVSQISACISHQGEVVSGRAELERLQAETEQRFAGKEVPLPDFWGGYRVVPDTVEFWQGRAGRLHDRLRFRQEIDEWVVERLSP